MSSSISAISNTVVKKTNPFFYSYNATTRTTTPSLLLSQAAALVSLTNPASASHTALSLARQISPEIPISTSPETHPSSCSIPSELINDPPPSSPDPKPGIEFPKPPISPPIGPDIPLPKPDVVPPPPPDKVPERPPGPEIFPPPMTQPEIDPPRPTEEEIVPPEIPTPDIWPPPHGPTWVI